jgi:hypothetical protein
LFSKESTRISVSSTSTHSPQTRLMRKFTTGSCRSLLRALKRAAVASKSVIRFAISGMRESLMKSIAGPTQTMQNQRKSRVLAMMNLVRITGGLDLGSLARSLVKIVVSFFLHKTCFFMISLIFLQTIKTSQ